MQGDRGTRNHFTKEMLDMAMRLWTRSSISLIDVRRRLISVDKPLLGYELPTSTLLYANGEMASVKLDQFPFQTGKFGIFHGGKGTELSVQPAGADVELYIILYKSDRDNQGGGHDGANACGDNGARRSRGTGRPAANRLFGGQ